MLFSWNVGVPVPKLPFNEETELFRSVVFGVPQFWTNAVNHTSTWRIIPVRNWLVTLVSKSPKDIPCITGYSPTDPNQFFGSLGWSSKYFPAPDGRSTRRHAVMRTTWFFLLLPCAAKYQIQVPVRPAFAWQAFWCLTSRNLHPWVFPNKFTWIIIYIYIYIYTWETTMDFQSTSWKFSGHHGDTCGHLKVVFHPKSSGGTHFEPYPLPVPSGYLT